MLHEKKTEIVCCHIMSNDLHNYCGENLKTLLMSETHYVGRYSFKLWRVSLMRCKSKPPAPLRNALRDVRDVNRSLQKAIEMLLMSTKYT